MAKFFRIELLDFDIRASFPEKKTFPRSSVSRFSGFERRCRRRRRRGPTSGRCCPTWARAPAEAFEDVLSAVSSVLTDLTETS